MKKLIKIILSNKKIKKIMNINGLLSSDLLKIKNHPYLNSNKLFYNNF